MHLLGLFADRFYDSIPLTFRAEPSRVGHFGKYPPPHPFFALKANCIRRKFLITLFLAIKLL